MTQSQNSLLTAGIICAATASVIVGIAVRDRVDIGGVRSVSVNQVVGSGLLASRTTPTEIPESKYFIELTQLLKQKYVEPIKDDMKLATGAVRGMVGSLNDVESIFYTPEMAKAYLNALKGKYEGIGADLELVRIGKSTSTAGQPDDPEDPLAATQLPRVVVMGVVPGGPADKAGVKPGDWVDSINGHWVYNAEALEELRTTQKKVQSKEWPSSKLHELSIKLRAKAEGALMPYKALEKLMVGDEGKLAIVWNRPGTAPVATNVSRGICDSPNVQEVSPGVLRVRIAKGITEKLWDALEDKSQITIDMRSMAYGDEDALIEALGAFGPQGKYGTLTREGGKPSLDVEVRIGNNKSPKMTILLDARSGGLYQAFALALASKTGATIIGKPTSPRVAQFHSLPDGSAYGLVVGTFHPIKAGESK